MCITKCCWFFSSIFHKLAITSIRNFSWFIISKICLLEQEFSGQIFAAVYKPTQLKISFRCSLHVCQNQNPPICNLLLVFSKVKISWGFSCYLFHYFMCARVAQIKVVFVNVFGSSIHLRCVCSFSLNWLNDRYLIKALIKTAVEAELKAISVEC